MPQSTQKRTNTLSDEPVEAFHLVCKREPGQPMMWVGVCVNEPLRKFISEREISDPHLVIVTTDNLGYNEERKMVPLTDGVVHLAFYRAGKFKVHAYVVWAGDRTSRSDLFRLVMNKTDHGSYENELYNSMSEWPREYLSSLVGEKKRRIEARIFQYRSTEEVVIPTGHFAPEPRRLTKAWVGVFFDGKRHDQCHFRRRLLWTIPLSFVLLLHYIAKSAGIVGASALGLVYNNGFKHAWKPGRYGGFRLVFGDIKGKHSFWFYKGSRNKYQLRSAWARTISLLLMIYAVAIGVQIVFGGRSGIQSLIAASIGLGLLIAAGTVIYLVSLLATKVFRVDKKMKAHRLNRKKKLKAKHLGEIEQLARSLETMSCKATGKPMTIERLLERRRRDPIVLYYTVKDKVCKPFQR